MQLSDTFLSMLFPRDFISKLFGVACPSAQAPSVFKPCTPSEISHWALNSTSFEVTKKSPERFQQKPWCSSSNTLACPCSVFGIMMGVVICMCPKMFRLAKHGKTQTNPLAQTFRIPSSSQQPFSPIKSTAQHLPALQQVHPGSSGSPGHVTSVTRAHTLPK